MDQDKNQDNNNSGSNPVGADAFAALRDRFAGQSRKAQAYYTVMHTARTLLKTDEAADAWMNTAAPGLDGKTPAEAVGEGRYEDALALAAALK